MTAQVTAVFAAMIVAYLIGRSHGRTLALRSLRTLAWFRAEADESREFAAKGEGHPEELAAARRLAETMGAIADEHEQEIRAELRR